MRRTYILLLCLGGLATALAGVRLLFPQTPADPITSEPPVEIQPTPTIPVQVAIPMAPATYTSSDIFEFQYGNRWELVPSQASASAQLDAFSLTTGSAATFDFRLLEASRSGLAQTLSCPQSDTCQVLPINGVNYQISLTQMGEETIQAYYKAVKLPYILEINGSFNGLDDAVETAIMEWDSITSSFTWKE
jgi:hypothetical protein